MIFQYKSLLIFVLCSVFSVQSFAEKDQYVCDVRRTEQSVVWALDISSSMDKAEYETQINGYVSALKDEGVQKNLFHCQCTEIAIVVWSDKAMLKYDFKQMRNEESLNDLITFLEGYQNSFDDNYTLGYMTNVFEALSFSASEVLKRSNKDQSPQLSITISGDGYNSRLDPKTLEEFRAQKQDLEASGVTVNGVPVVIYEYEDMIPMRNGPFSSFVENFSTQGSSTNKSGFENVADFYKKEVVTSDGYIEKAETFEDFGRAIKKSILRDTCKLMM